jgi:hypothetical protein
VGYGDAQKLDERIKNENFQQREKF